MGKVRINWPVHTYIIHTHIHTYTHLLTYLLTPWCRILLEKLTGLQLVKKFPAFHGTQRLHIHTYTHTYMHTYIHAHIHTYTHT